MARVQGPLHSDGASGSIAGQLTFSSWKGRQYVRRLVIPSNPRSATQTAFRAMMKFLSQAWASLATARKNSWQDRATQMQVSLFNAYTSYNQDRWSDAIEPVQDATYTHTPSGNTTGTPVPTAVGRQVTVDLTHFAASSAWGYIVYRKLAGAPTGVLAEVVGVVPDVGGVGQLVDNVPSAGTWHYKALQFDDLGDTYVLSLDSNVVVA